MVKKMESKENCVPFLFFFAHQIANITRNNTTTEPNEIANFPALLQELFDFFANSAT